MVRRNVVRWTLATLVLLVARGAPADPINFTGSVAQDFNPSRPDVQVAGSDALFQDPNPLDRIYQLPAMTQQGLITGWAIKDIRTSYDAASDTLSVGLNIYSIAGRAVGAGGLDIEGLLAQQGGIDPPYLGGHKSITVAVALGNPDGSNTPGTPVIVAGVPADKLAGGPGLDGFTVARYAGRVNQGIQNNYGVALPENLGALAYDPSKDHPGFEFTIAHFSKIFPGRDPTRGFWLQAYAGSPDDDPVGEEQTQFVHFAAIPQQAVPEPGALLAWCLAAIAVRRRLRRRGKA